MRGHVTAFLEHSFHFAKVYYDRICKVDPMLKKERSTLSQPGRWRRTEKVSRSCKRIFFLKRTEFSNSNKVWNFLCVSLKHNNIKKHLYLKQRYWIVNKYFYRTKHKSHHEYLFIIFDLGNTNQMFVYPNQIFNVLAENIRRILLNSNNTKERTVYVLIGNGKNTILPVFMILIVVQSTYMMFKHESENTFSFFSKVSGYFQISGNSSACSILQSSPFFPFYNSMTHGREVFWLSSLFPVKERRWIFSHFCNSHDS